jgi:hypothetical protein
MQQMEKTHGKRVRQYLRPITSTGLSRVLINGRVALASAFTISEASRAFGKDRVGLHRWINAGVLKKCDKHGTRAATGKFVWGADVDELLRDPDRKRGKPLRPLKKRKRRMSKFLLRKVDPEQSGGGVDHWHSLTSKLNAALLRLLAGRDISTLRDDERAAIAATLQPIADICAAMRQR